VQLSAPPQAGIYYIIFAFRGELTGAQMASATNWPLGYEVWNDGNDIADFSSTQISEAQQNGVTVVNWLYTSGYLPTYTPACAITLVVGAHALSASASAVPTEGYIPLFVQFTGLASGGSSPYLYFWDFGDGSLPSIEQSPSHTYENGGSYKATLTVVDSAGNIATSSVGITATLEYSITKLRMIPTGSPSGEYSWSTADNEHRYHAGFVGKNLLFGNFWNLKDSAGSVKMSYGDTLEAQIAFSHANLKEAWQIVGGYPESIYGYSPNFGPYGDRGSGYSSTQFAALQFPIMISSFPKLWSVVDYSVAQSDSNPLPIMDFAYDIWLTPDYKPYYPPSGGVPPAGVVELMIWTYYNDLNPIGYDAGSTSYSIPTWIDHAGGSGTLQESLQWNVYVGRAGKLQDKQTVISFVLPSKEQNAIIGVDMKAVLNGVISILSSKGWSSSTLNKYYVNGIELGSEFGPEHDGESANYLFTIRNYHYVIDRSAYSDDLVVPREMGSTFFSCPTSSDVESIASAMIYHSSTSVNQPDAGVSTTIIGSTASDGTSVTITSTKLAGKPTSIIEVSTIPAAYYDVNVRGITDGMATICFTTGGVTSQTTMQYWNGAQWIKAGNVVVSGNTISGDIPVSALTGTIIAIGPLSLPPPSVTISPLSASILTGQSVTFNSTVSGGATPYSYQWYLNGNPVSGATSNTWTFTPTSSGIYYVYLKVIDAASNTKQSETTRITVATVPVGGYSIPIQTPATLKPITPYLILTAILTIAYTTIKRKTTRKPKQQ